MGVNEAKICFSFLRQDICLVCIWGESTLEREEGGHEVLFLLLLRWLVAATSKINLMRTAGRIFYVLYRWLVGKKNNCPPVSQQPAFLLLILGPTPPPPSPQINWTPSLHEGDG